LHQARYLGYPLALSASCPAGQGDTLALLAAAGYRQARWFHFMSRRPGGAGAAEGSRAGSDCWLRGLEPGQCLAQRIEAHGS
jgi:hypothetical protein